ncbi:hypothetical protein F6U93_07840 [Tamlana haliotis]|uniref:Uncharacterized protein n=1 Tax=Pseudotamlana haliotis TaxID=2614804 RepID=A0A6N6ME73_9FLAO|nr:hypothetical protein [Tamlana haliotis]KAB1068039.1 hypothetical protein F6U93_07840 [Tamlana haliotis]
MKKIFVLLLLLLCFSCDQKYEYIEVVKEKSLYTGITEVLEKSETMKSKNDSTAYFRAYLRFYTSKKMYKKNKEQNGENKNFELFYSKPIKFKLLNKKGEDLAISPSYIDREQIEHRIRKIVDGMSHLQ